MKIALCSSFVPFIRGGARNIVEWLQEELVAIGHQVERIYLPQIDVPDLILPQMAAYRWIDLASTADRVICFRPPAHAIPHPHKILWFIHHVRVFYDLWDSPYRGFPEDDRHRNLRDILHRADTEAIREAKHVFTNSRVVSERLQRYNRIDSEVLYPPIFRPERFHCADYNDEIVYICRVEHHKRQHLLLEAMRYTRTPVRLRLCGASAGEAYAKELQSTAASRKLRDRVIFDHRWITEEEKSEILAHCLAAAYLPLDEDSYGYPSLEASHAAKPILTTSDSGGVLELVVDGLNGRVCDPDPKALAEAMDELYRDREKTRQMGANAAQRIKDLDISWQHVLERLLA
ncbi:glycosyltransferase family 4 protein [Azoarcus sp. KH32C]|uniref:glycosyltransferase family 4 protein n=1 Tax=Azoarcus sp. KH32C TaxID=748247 RepID=UPI00023866AE|nr:glycosyltransferase family 4 protein [Azoarcus sp. KH32C]BAL22591.1 glycosyltransferase family protein [Azoarcus sp. KH32C]